MPEEREREREINLKSGAHDHLKTTHIISPTTHINNTNSQITAWPACGWVPHPAAVRPPRATDPSPGPHSAGHRDHPYHPSHHPSLLSIHPSKTAQAAPQRDRRAVQHLHRHVPEDQEQEQAHHQTHPARRVLLLLLLTFPSRPRTPSPSPWPPTPSRACRAGPSCRPSWG